MQWYLGMGPLGSNKNWMRSQWWGPQDRVNAFEKKGTRELAVHLFPQTLTREVHVNTQQEHVCLQTGMRALTRT